MAYLCDKTFDLFWVSWLQSSPNGIWLNTHNIWTQLLVNNQMPPPFWSLVDTHNDTAFGDVFLHLLTGHLTLLSDEFGSEEFCAAVFDSFLLTSCSRWGSFIKKKKIQLLSCMYLLISVYVITQVSFANFYSFVQFSSSIHKLLNNFCVTAKRTYIGILYAFWTTSVWKCIHQLWKPWWRLLSLPNRFVKQCVVLSQCIDMSHCYVKLPLYTVWNVSGLSDAIL